MENDREGEKLIDEYNSQIENILTLETKVQIEAFKIDTEIHLSLKAYVEKHEGNISSYQTKIEEVEKQKKAEKEKKRLAEAEKKQLKLFGIVTGKKISEYNVKKIIHEEDGMVHALVDPPVKNFDFGYYRVVYSKPSEVIVLVSGYTSQTFGKYNHLERVEQFFATFEKEEEAEEEILKDFFYGGKKVCTMTEMMYVVGVVAPGNTESIDSQKKMVNAFFDSLPKGADQSILTACYMVDTYTYDIETPKRRVLNEMDGMLENKQVGEECRIHMNDYVKIFKEKYNIPSGKINTYRRQGKGVKIKKYPGYFSVFEMQRTKMHIEDKNGMIWITCSDSIPSYDSKVRGGITLVNLEVYAKSVDASREYIENLKKKKIEEQKQEKIRKEKEDLEKKDKEGL